MIRAAALDIVAAADQRSFGLTFALGQDGLALALGCALAGIAMLIGRTRAVALPKSILAHQLLALGVTFTSERARFATRLAQFAQPRAIDGRLNRSRAAHTATANRLRRLPGAAATANRLRWLPGAAAIAHPASAVLSALSSRPGAATLEISVLIAAAEDCDQPEHARGDPKLHARLLTRRAVAGNGSAAVVVITEF